MKIGEINKLTVKRISDIAYVLETKDKEEIFLHKKEAQGNFDVGETVFAFLYYDSYGRIAASTATPKITISKPAFLRVVSVDERLGFFLDDGMPKDLLLSMKDFPYPIDYAPEPGDYLFVRIEEGKTNFRTKLLPKEAFLEFMHPSGMLKVRDWVKGYIVNIVPSGIVAFDTEGREYYVPNELTRDKHRIGEEVEINIMKVIDDRRYQGSLLKPKLEQLNLDSKKILKYLTTYKKIELTDKSDPLEIYRVFHMSKKAYKDAIGKLYKEKYILIHDDFIELIYTPTEKLNNIK